jgi:hypothetical protein
LADLPAAELRRYFDHVEAASADRHQQRGRDEIGRAASLLRENPAAGCRAEIESAIAEIQASIENSGCLPVPPKLTVPFSPATLWRYANHPVGRGRHPAVNLSGNEDPDSSRRQPGPSTFWKAPGDVAARNLHAGFGRAELPRYDDRVWSYRGPKTSTGAHPGFELENQDCVIKVKFGEVHSEPFASRVFDALGYHVTPTDFAPRLWIRYDRRLIREFHQRRDLKTRLQLPGGLPVLTIHFQRRFDPFQFIAWAELDDGTTVNGEELRRGLLPRTRQADFPEDLPGNFDTAFERRVRLLVTVPANIEVKSSSGNAVGPWNFGGLQHEDLRELRGLGLLAAWVCWFDSRPINTRLRIDSAGDGEVRLRHCLSDLGGCLGSAHHWMFVSTEEPNSFGWRFTRPRRVQGPGRMTLPFRIVRYQPVEETPAFSEMTWDDARWMARWIGQLTEEQIVSALVAAGFDSASTRLYAEKLVSRRDWMIHDLELEGEIPLLRPRPTNHRFDYDPVVDGGVLVRPSESREELAPVSDLTVVRGRLIRRGSGMMDLAKPSPGGLRENSPAFQRWVSIPAIGESREGQERIIADQRTDAIGRR